MNAVVYSSIVNYPTEILINILQNLSAHDLGTMGKVCLLFQKLCNDPLLWKSLCQREDLEISGQTNDYKEFFLENSRNFLSHKIRNAKEIAVENLPYSVRIDNGIWKVIHTLKTDGEKVGVYFKDDQNSRLTGPYDANNNFRLVEPLLFQCRINRKILGVWDLNTLDEQSKARKGTMVQGFEETFQHKYLHACSSSWLLLANEDKTQLFDRKTLQLFCILKSDENKDFTAIDRAMLFRSYCCICTLLDPTLFLYDLTHTQQVENQTVLLPFKSVSVRSHFFSLMPPHFAFLSKSADADTVTFFNIKTKIENSINLAEVIPDFSGEIYSFEDLGNRLFCRTNKLCFVYDRDSKTCLFYKKHSNTHWDLYPLENCYLERTFVDHQTTPHSHSWSLCLRNYSDLEPKSEIIEKISAYQTQKTLLFALSHLQETLGIWDIRKGVCLRKVTDLESVFSGGALFYTFAKQVLISSFGKTQSLRITFESKRKADSSEAPRTSSKKAFHSRKDL